MNCADCGVLTVPGRRLRGLCKRCYQRHRKRGTHIDFERVNRSRAEVIEEWLRLRSDGYSRVFAAYRMGMTPGALDTAIARAKRRGEVA